MGTLVAPVAYGLLNVLSATGIVFANKAVFSVIHFSFTYALTFIHTLFTLAGMHVFLKFGVFERKTVSRRKMAPLAAAYVGYIVLCNLNLNLNPVGFYQISKIAVAPAVLAIEAVAYGKRASPAVTGAVGLVCAGVGLATVTDPQIARSAAGLGAGFGSVAATAMYQVWAGVKQKELGLGSMQLLHQYVPLAAGMLGILVLLLEPVGWLGPVPGTILGFHLTLGGAATIALSAALGLLVNLSTFLVIGATSSLTYNVVGHVKTVIILSGGVAFFGDAMPAKKLIGIGVAMMGIIWYSHIKLQESRANASAKLALPLSTQQSVSRSGVPTTTLGSGNMHTVGAGYRSPKMRTAM